MINRLKFLFLWWIVFLIIFVLPYLRPIANMAPIPDNSKVVIRDNANVLTDTSFFSSKEFNDAIIVIESFESIPLDSANWFIKKHFEDLSLVYGNSFRDYGILVIGSKKQNIAASWMGEAYNNIKCSSQYYRKSKYFELEIDSTTSVEMKIDQIFVMTIDACQNTTVLKQFAEDQIWNILNNFTKPSPKIWYRFFVYPSQWCFAKLIVSSKSFWGWTIFLFFYIYISKVLTILADRIISKSKLEIEKKLKLESLVCTIIRYVFYYIPITLGLLPIATFVSTSGVEYFGIYSDLGFTQQLLTSIFNSNLSSINTIVSFISVVLFIAIKQPLDPKSVNNFSIMVFTVSIINGVISAVFFFLPIGLNIVFWALTLPSFFRMLNESEKVTIVGKSITLPAYVIATRTLFWSFLIALALYLGVLRTL